MLLTRIFLTVFPLKSPGLSVVGHLLFFTQFVPLDSKQHADLSIVGLWLGPGQDRPLYPRPNHEGIHGPFDVAFFLVEFCCVKSIIIIFNSS